jgi:membrane-bound serine protease (ClpP class)
MPRRIFLLALLSLSFWVLTLTAAAGAPHVDVLRVEGTINPVLASYMDRGIGAAESDGATVCVIELDTPGGLDTSMRDIVQRITSARLPVVVYVSPPGARAASAGVFITMAAHVAAMAPNTTIGAAHPVAIGSSGEVQKLPEEMEEKVLNDAVAYIKSIAGGHGRNVEWAEKAVRESICATDREALELNVIDLVAPDLPSLLSQLDGREVAMLSGETITLHTRDAVINRIEMGAIERFLFTISDPTIAYILLSLGMLGIFFELSSPGTIFPGVFGGICFLLGFYSLGMLPVNYAGLLLMILGFGLFVAELFTPTFGLLTAGGVVSFTVGSLILFGGGSSLFKVDLGVIIGVVAVITLVFVFIVYAVVRGQRRRPVTGHEGLIGQVAVARTALDPAGTVFLEGEAWSAVAEGSKRIEAGEEVMVTRVDGLKLVVKKKK